MEGVFEKIFTTEARETQRGTDLNRQGAEDAKDKAGEEVGGIGGREIGRWIRRSVYARR